MEEENWKQPYRLKNLVNGAKRVELMRDGRLNIHWGRKEYYVDDYLLLSPKTRNKEYVLSDVTDLKYIFIVNWESAKLGLIKEKCDLILHFCRDIAPEIKNVVLNVDGLSLKEFINSSVDFKKLLPGLNVKVEVTGDEILIWSWERQNNRFYISQYPERFDVEITDSYGTKTYHFWKNYR